MSYAVIQLLGKQHKIAQGDTIVVDRLETPESDTITVTDVLMVSDGKTAKFGTPLVKGAEVTLKVVDHHKADKIRVFTYKAKSRYRKTKGHRQAVTTLEVVKIS
jgi:large subunit ribosomal protein L21